MTKTTLPKPDHATSNMRLVGYSDQAGRCDGVQIMVHRGYAYIGHIFSTGFSIVDVRDPKKPQTVRYVASPPNTWSLHLQAFDDLLLVVHNKDMFAQPELADEKNYYKGSVDHHAKHEAKGRDWSAGMAVYDISKPDQPKQIGFMPVEGTGLHRMWYVGGRWAYASALLDGFSDYILITIDLQDPKNPVMAGKYWLPGMNVAAGEKPNWPTKNGRFGLHHAIINDDIAYCSWRDACLAVVDVKDKAIGFNIVIYIEGPFKFLLLGAPVSLYSLLVGLEGAAFITVFVHNVIGTARKLRDRDDALAKLRVDQAIADHGRIVAISAKAGGRSGAM